MYELCARREAEKNENGKKESKKIKNGCVYINLCISQVINCTTSYQFFFLSFDGEKKKAGFFQCAPSNHAECKYQILKHIHKRIQFQFYTI